MKKQWFKFFVTGFCLISSITLKAQADNEIQVYASPTIGEKRTIVELHNNYTFKGSKKLGKSEGCKVVKSYTGNNTWHSQKR